MKNKKSKINIDIVDLTGNLAPQKRQFFTNIVKSVFKFAGIDCSGMEINVNLAFAGETEMKKINKEWRGKNKTTDVLSFSNIDAPQGRLANKMIGIKSRKKIFLFDNENQIVICLPYAKNQAKKLKLTQKQNLARLFSHGILHILGYDHERSEGEARIMEEIQDRIFKEL